VNLKSPIQCIFRSEAKTSTLKLRQFMDFGAGCLLKLFSLLGRGGSLQDSGSGS